MPQDPILVEGVTELGSLRNVTLHRRWSYYTGHQPRVWVTDKFANLFRDLADSMGDNYCSLAINTRLARMEITGWEGPQAEAAETQWEADRWPTKQSNYYRWGLGYGLVYLIAEKGGEEGDTLAPNRPTLVSHIAAGDDPLRVEAAVKSWWDRGTWRVNVYDDTDVRRFVADGGKADKMPKPEDFKPDPEDEGGPHGFDQCPVIVAYPYGFEAPVLMDTVRGAQDRINKIGSNKFVAAEFSAYNQRVFFTRQDISDNDVANAPDRAIILDPGENDEARVQELTGGDLAKFDAAKQAEVDTFFTLALLPRHLMVNPGTAPSGAAIKADEGPLVEAVTENHQLFGDSLSEGMALLGIDANPVWDNPEVSDGLATAQETKTFTDAGVPWQAAVKKVAGWTEDEFTDLGLDADGQGTDAVVEGTVPPAVVPPLSILG